MSEEIDFYYSEENEDVVTEPQSAGEEYRNLVQQDEVQSQITSLSQNDVRVFDALVLGWYIYPPVNQDLYIGRKSQRESCDCFEEVEVSNTKLMGKLDTLLSVSTPENTCLFITSPLYDSQSPVVDQLIQNNVNKEKIVLPIDSNKNEKLSSEHPVAQVIPIRRDLLDVESDYGITTENIQEDINELKALKKFYDNPYMEQIRREKPVTSVENNNA